MEISHKGETFSYPFLSHSRCETKRAGGKKLNFCRDFNVPPGSNLACAPFVVSFPFDYELRDCLKSSGLGDGNIQKGADLPQRIYHSETPPGENQNLFARLTVRIIPTYGSSQDLTLQQSMAKSTERQVQQIAYQGKL